MGVQIRAWWRKMGRERNKRADEAAQSRVTQPRELVFVAPADDDLTRVMCSWLEKIALEEGGRCRKIFRSDARAGVLREILEIARKRRVLLVFYGHGNEEALLTGWDASLGEPQGVPVATLRPSVLLSSDDVSAEQTFHIIAYCCLSAKDLGERVRAVNKGGRYLGYVGELPFEMDSQCRDAFKAPMEAVIRKLLKNGGELGAGTRAVLLEAYQQEWREWMYGEFSNHERATWVCMCLEDHISKLCAEV